MNKLDIQYQDLLQDILNNGVMKEDRTGTGTYSVFGRQIRHKMSDGFPVLTTKKMAWRQIVTELLWFLNGDTNIKYLVDNNCHIWDGDCYKNYCKLAGSLEEPDYSVHVDDPVENRTRLMTKEEFINKIKTDDVFAKEWGNLGPVYGKQWRSWETKLGYMSTARYDLIVDQIQNLINDIKTDPDSRRVMVNAWNVGELDSMVLPPCHYGFQVYTRELSLNERAEYFEKLRNTTRGVNWDWTSGDEADLHEVLNIHNIPTRAVSLMWNQRSVDTFLGLPFNIASYGLLLEIIAKEVNMVPDELIGNLGDVHIYKNHIEAVNTQLFRTLPNKERYNIWFNNNYETGMEYNFDENALPDFDDDYYTPTPKTRRKDSYPLPKLIINTEFWKTQSGECGIGPFDTNLKGFKIDDFELENYQSQPTIKAPLSN